MSDRFDALARDAAGNLPRRELFLRVGGVFLGVLLAAVKINAKSDCGKLCAACCHALDFPPRSQALAQCIKDCHEGRGICGVQVCPDGKGQD